jgi:rhodanese-related sulfurtransferase
MSKLSVTVNAILGVAIMLFVFTLVWRYIEEGSFIEGTVSKDGKRISLSGIQFSEHEQTVLLALDKDCRFCKQEAPFYRQLASEAGARGTRLVVVFQHNLKAGREYLSAEHIEASDLVRVHLNSIGVEATPTLMVLNREGLAIGKWSGSLSQPLHEYLLSILGSSEATIRNSGSPFLSLGNLTPPPVIDAASLKAELKAGEAIILDVDEREAFAAEHLEGAVNLPEDEIYARAQNELTKAKSIVVFSVSRDPVRISNARVSLDRVGFVNLAWLRLSMDECRTAGLSVAGQGPLTGKGKGE